MEDFTKPDIEIARRDWLKAAALGGAGSLIAQGSLSADTGNAGADKVRGVIFMVSDGMSPGVLTMAQAFSKLVRERGTAWWDLLNDHGSARGLMDTASANSMVTDSAAASSSWGSGHRVNNGAINFTPEGKELEPIGKLLKKKGVKIGLVSTATITHATPAGFAASEKSRGDEARIAPQYLDRVDVILGGGTPFFTAKTGEGGKKLFEDFKAHGYGVVSKRADLLASKDAKLLGTFASGHLPYTIDRNNNPAIAEAVPTLEEMSRAALARFLEGDAPFLLQIEGARIDHAAHLNDIGGLLWDQLAFDDALAAVLALTAERKDILVVVTSDHGNSNPGLNGMGGSYSQSTPSFARIKEMKASHERLFGEWRSVRDGTSEQLTAMIRAQLGFALRPDQADALLEIFRNRPVIEWNEQLSKPEGLLGQFAGNHTGIGWVGTTHTSDPTLVSARGPQADRFSGMVVNSGVFGHLMDMLG
jgi:alkaline phosphatase